MKYYLYNGSGSTVTLSDIGLEIADGENFEIDPNDIDDNLLIEGGELETKINAEDLVLTTDITCPPATQFSAEEALELLSLRSWAREVVYDDTVTGFGVDNVQEAIESISETSQNKVIIQDEGGNIPNTPHGTVNFIGAGVTASDAGGGITNITIPGGAGDVFGEEFDEAYDDAEETTTSTNYLEKLKLSLTSVPAGDYRIGAYCEGSMKTQAARIKIRVQVDDTDIIFEQETGYQDDWTSYCGFSYYTFSAGNHSIDLDFATTNGNIPVYIRKAKIEIWRVE